MRATHESGLEREIHFCLATRVGDKLVRDANGDVVCVEFHRTDEELDRLAAELREWQRRAETFLKSNADEPQSLSGIMRAVGILLAREPILLQEVYELSAEEMNRLAERATAMEREKGWLSAALTFREWARGQDDPVRF